MKQVIVMRKDLKMRKGKMVAQGAHASLAVFFNRRVEDHDRILDEDIIAIKVDPVEFKWIEGEFTKICVGISGEDELTRIYADALVAHIPCALIRDLGKTEFKGVPTYTCCAIGPAEDGLIDEITGHLKLL